MQKEKLRIVRKRKGFTQQQVADFLHTDISNYCRKENGETKIIKEEWDKIAHFLEVPLEEIFEDDEVKVIINNNGENSGAGSGTYNTSGAGSGTHNTNYNIPNSIIENLQDYIALLKEENTTLKKEIEILKENIK